MDNNDRKPGIFVSTFRLALKPHGRPFCSGKQTENGQNTAKKVFKDNKLEVLSATDSKQGRVGSLEAPCFKQLLRDCSVCDGGDVTFQTVLTGSQPLSVTWLHNGEKVNSSKTSFKDGVACLALTRCSPENSGVYTCVAENSAGKQSSSAALHVTAPTKEIPGIKNHKLHDEVKFKDASSDRPDPPSDSGQERWPRGGKDKGVSGINNQTKRGPPVEFLDPPGKVEVRVGERAQLQCEFRSSSHPVASCWIFNKVKVVRGSPRTAVRSTRTQASVELSQAESGDTGLYTVIVRNRLGSAQHTVSLSVIDRPSPPASQPAISHPSGQSLVLSWSGPSYDGGTAVLGYVVEVSRDDGDRPESWTEISRCKNTSYHIRSGLEPLGRYRFRVRAYNSAGISEPSQKSGSVKMENAKEKKVEPVTYITVTIDTKHKVKDHYEVHEKLGVGKFGQVFRLTHRETGQVCAGKFYRARTTKEKSAARREIQIMNKLHHPKLVQCLAAYDTRSEMVMVMEYIAGGELFERIVDDHFEHTEPTCARYVQQILEGMQYVHKQNIVHLDLKPENIVCVDTTGTRIKIIDFGLASELEKGKSLMVMHGTPEFVAPEVINYEPVGLGTDMWSIGVICFILLSGESPFQGDSDAQTLALVTAASFEFDPESFEDISDEAKDFISSLLKKDLRARLSCTEALAHCWMASFTPLTRRPTKSLNKQRMKRFLARRKWKKTGQAVLAVQRMANLSCRPDSPGSSSEEPVWSPEAEEAIKSLDKQLQTEPRFQWPLKDADLPVGATAQLACLVDGYPQPAVTWLQNDEPVSESCRVTTEQRGDGLCSLVLTDLQPSDSGVYMCRAKNELGEATSSAKLKVGF